MVGAIGFESERQRNYNNVERSRRHVLRSFRCRAVRAACKWHGPLTRRNSWPHTQLTPAKAPQFCYSAPK